MSSPPPQTFLLHSGDFKTMKTPKYITSQLQHQYYEQVVTTGQRCIALLPTEGHRTVHESVPFYNF